MDWLQAKRLLIGKTASDDAEKAMISKLKMECGRQAHNPTILLALSCGSLAEAYVGQYGAVASSATPSLVPPVAFGASEPAWSAQLVHEQARGNVQGHRPEP